VSSEPRRCVRWWGHHDPRPSQHTRSKAEARANHPDDELSGKVRARFLGCHHLVPGWIQWFSTRANMLHAQARQRLTDMLAGACEVLDPRVERAAPPLVVRIGKSRCIRQETIEVIECEQQPSSGLGPQPVLRFARCGMHWLGQLGLS
jgi:hypothetical protein